MKNIIVKANRDFDDYEGAEVISGNPCVKRKKDEVFCCTKERYLYLKEKKAVRLVGMKKQS